MVRAKGTSDKVVEGLLDFLKESGEEQILPEVATLLDDKVTKTKKADEILVTSTVPFSARYNALVQSFIKKQLKLDLPVKNNIDKTILGGFTIKVGDWFLDASIAKDMKNIKNLLLS